MATETQALMANSSTSVGGSEWSQRVQDQKSTSPAAEYPTWRPGLVPLVNTSAGPKRCDSDARMVWCHGAPPQNVMHQPLAPDLFFVGLAEASDVAGQRHHCAAGALPQTGIPHVAHLRSTPADVQQTCPRQLACTDAWIFVSFGRPCFVPWRPEWRSTLGLRRFKKGWEVKQPGRRLRAVAGPQPAPRMASGSSFAPVGLPLTQPPRTRRGASGASFGMDAEAGGHARLGSAPSTVLRASHATRPQRPLRSLSMAANSSGPADNNQASPAQTLWLVGRGRPPMSTPQQKAAAAVCTACVAVALLCLMPGLQSHTSS